MSQPVFLIFFNIFFLPLALGLLTVRGPFLVRAHVHEGRLKGSGERDDHRPRVVLVHILLDLGQPEIQKQNKTYLIWYKEQTKEACEGWKRL